MGSADKKQLMKNGKNNCRRREKIIDANQADAAAYTKK